MDSRELRSAIEAILLVAGEPVTVENLKEVFSDETDEAIGTALEELRSDLEKTVSGFAIEQTAGGFRFATRPEFDSFLRKYFSKQNEGRLSIAALETLAMIAYRQPITAPEISDIRGVNSAGVLRTLLDRKLIRIAGRKNVVGSPFLYRTTREFLLHFGLNSIQDLPKLEEFAEVLGENLTEEMLLNPNLSDEGEEETSVESSTGTEGSAAEESGEQISPATLNEEPESAENGTNNEAANESPENVDTVAGENSQVSKDENDQETVELGVTDHSD